jgi:hypothetical protein
MSGNSTSEQKTSQATSNSFDPWVTSAGQNLVSNSIADAASHPFQQYTGGTQGAFGVGTGQAQDLLTSKLATGGVDPGTTAASDAYKSIMDSINPNASVASYMNPYTDNVLAPTIRNLNESADQAQQRTGAGASMAGAWGGSGNALEQFLNNRGRTQAITDATGSAYGKAFDSATAARTSALQTLLAATGGEQSSGAQAGTQSNTLATLLAGLGGQEQQANQTGINTAIGVNTSNQAGQLSQDTSLAQILAMVPKNTQGMSNGTNTSTTPDNSGMALLGSVLGKLI